MTTENATGPDEVAYISGPQQSYKPLLRLTAEHVCMRLQSVI